MIEQTKNGKTVFYRPETEADYARVQGYEQGFREGHAWSFEAVAAFRTLLEHAKETYPHFESERGQRDIAAAETALARHK